MTRAEAIEVLKLVEENVSCDDCLYYAQMEDCPIDEDCIIVQAVRMAKQALSQEPCERFEWGIDGNVYKITKAKDGKEICQQVCKDAISRDAVYRLVDDIIDDLCANSLDLGALESWGREQVMKLPSVTPKPIECGDAISREAAINIASLHCLTIDESVKALEQLPSVTQKSGKWILVSERLPEDNGYYLTTTMYHEVYCDYWEEDRFNRTEAVIAWMPLPTPYEPQESEEV